MVNWPFSPLQNTSPGNSPLFDVDLGGFELVDSGGMSAEALLSQEDPVIFHKVVSRSAEMLT